MLTLSLLVQCWNYLVWPVSSSIVLGEKIVLNKSIVRSQGFGWLNMWSRTVARLCAALWMSQG